MLRFQIQDEDGNVIGTPIDIGSRLLNAVSPTCLTCWRFIDPYGDTIFNQIQIPFLIDDIVLVRASVKDTADIQLLDRIEQLAKEGLKEPHLYFKVIGD